MNFLVENNVLAKRQTETKPPIQILLVENCEFVLLHLFPHFRFKLFLIAFICFTRREKQKRKKNDEKQQTIIRILLVMDMGLQNKKKIFCCLLLTLIITSSCCAIMKNVESNIFTLDNQNFIVSKFNIHSAWIAQNLCSNIFFSFHSPHENSR